MSQRLILEGKRAELNQKKIILIIKCKALAKSIKESLAMSDVDPVADLDAAGVKALAGEFKEAHDEFMDVMRNIETINKELGE